MTASLQGKKITVSAPASCVCMGCMYVHACMSFLWYCHWSDGELHLGVACNITLYNAGERREGKVAAITQLLWLPEERLPSV